MSENEIEKSDKEWIKDWTDLLFDHAKNNSDLVLSPEGCRRLAEYLLELRLYRLTPMEDSDE